MDELTERQRKILEFIASFHERAGYPPSLREIAATFEINVNGVQAHLTALEKKGYVKRTDGRGRALKIIDRRVHSKGPLGIAIGAALQDLGEGFRLPLVAKIPAGNPVAVEDQHDRSVEISSRFFGGGSAKDATVAVEVSGNSMAGDAIMDGDLAIIKLQQTARPSDIVAVRIDRDEVTLKRLVRHPENHPERPDLMELRPSNPEYKTRLVPADQVEIVGVLTGIIRKI